MIVINKLKHAIPVVRPMSHAAKRERAMLQYRRHVPLGGAGKLESLNPEEADKLRVYDAALWLETPPKWNGIEFPFAAYGEPGCAYDLPARVASFLCEKYNRGAEVVMEMEGDQILEMIEREKLPAGVTPIRPNLDDPLVWSSESYATMTPQGMKTISRGLAEPPEPYDAKEIAVPVAVVLSGKKSSTPPVSSDEPVLNRP